MLSAAWTALTSRIGRYLAAIGAALAILFAAYRRGANDAQAKQATKHFNEINKARKVEHEVDGLDSDSVRRDLSKWMRD